MCFWSKPRLVFQTVRFSMVDARLSWVYYIAPSIPAEICQVWEVSRPSMCLFTFERFLMISCAFPLWTSLWGAINSPRFHHFKWCFTSPSNRGQSWLRHQFSGEILRSTCSTVHPPIFKEMSHPFPVPLHHTETLPLWQFTRGIAGSRGRARRLGQTVVQWEISRILKWRYCTI